MSIEGETMSRDAIHMTLSADEEPLRYAPSKVSWATAEFVRRPPAWMPRIFLYAVLASLLIGVVYMSLTKVAIHVDARGVLVTEPRAMPIVVPVAFRVARLLVQENQVVKAGDVLVSTDDELSREEFDRIAQAVRTIQAALSADRAGQCADCRGRLARIGSETFGASDVAAVRGILAPAHEALNQLLTALPRSPSGSKVAREWPPPEGGAAAERELEQARDRLDARLGAALGSLGAYRSERRIVAPIDGVVHRLMLSGVGQFVGAGSEIMQLLPSHAAFVAELGIANGDVSRVRAGLPVILRLDAFPERYYGALGGTVQTVPLSSTSSDGSTAPVYTVVVKLDRPSMRAGDREEPFRIGMQLEGRIVTRHVSMLANAVDKLLSLSSGVAP